MRNTRIGLIAACAFAAGCSPGAPAVKVPSIAPDKVAQRAMDSLDANKDGALDDNELKAAPGLRAAKAAFDGNKDGKLSLEEIAARFRRYAEVGTALVGSGCSVTLDRQPLGDATVTLTPEPFLGEEFPKASGTTDARGEVLLQVDGQPMAGVFCGLYRVEIVTGGGRALPARYNAKTELGCEVPPPGLSRSATILTFSLTSK